MLTGSNETKSTKELELEADLLIKNGEVTQGIGILRLIEQRKKDLLTEGLPIEIPDEPLI